MQCTLAVLKRHTITFLKHYFRLYPLLEIHEQETEAAMSKLGNQANGLKEAIRLIESAGLSVVSAHTFAGHEKALESECAFIVDNLKVRWKGCVLRCEVIKFHDQQFLFSLQKHQSKKRNAPLQANKKVRRLFLYPLFRLTFLILLIIFYSISSSQHFAPRPRRRYVLVYPLLRCSGLLTIFPTLLFQPSALRPKWYLRIAVMRQR